MRRTYTGRFSIWSFGETTVNQAAMTNRLHIFHHALRRICGMAFVMLFAIMSTFAAGTMLEKSETGVSVIICTGASSHTIQVDADGNPIAPQHTPCEWSVQALAIDAISVDLFARDAFYSRVVHVPVSDWMHPATAQTQQNNRGPPILLYVFNFILQKEYFYGRTRLEPCACPRGHDRQFIPFVSRRVALAFLCRSVCNPVFHHVGRDRHVDVMDRLS
jgi:hypothetical protein